jgi:hypothetical protein
MSVTTQRSVPLPTVEFVAERHTAEAQDSDLTQLGHEVGIASIWIVFYVVVAVAATIRYVFNV